MHTRSKGGKWLFAALAIVLAAGPMSMAQAGGSIGVRGSFYDGSDSDEGVWMPGLQMRLFMGKRLALEGAVDYRKEEFAGDTVDVVTWPVQASLMLFLFDEDRALRPYFLGGAGWYFTTAETNILGIDESETSDRFGTHAGAGLQVKLGESLSLSGDYRFIWVEKFTSQDVTLGEKEFEDSGSQVALGLNFHF